MKKKFFLITVIFFSTILGILILELAIRLIKPQNLIVYNNDIWMSDEDFGHKKYPNIKTKTNPGGAKLVNFRTNEDGFRINFDDSEIENKIDKKILIIGDSFLEAFQVNNEDSISELLKKKIKEKYNTDIFYYNTAVSGWNPNHYLKFSRMFLEKNNKIDLGLVFLYLPNDMVDYETSKFKKKHNLEYPAKFKIPKNFSWSSITDSIFLPINDYFEQRSHLFTILKFKNEVILSKLGLTHYQMEKIFYKNHNSKLMAEITFRICDNIKRTFEKKNTKVLFILIPASYQINKNLFSQYLKGFNVEPDMVDIKNPQNLFIKRIKETKSNMLYIDLLPALDSLNKEEGPFFGEIDRHFNEKGHVTTTNIILNDIVKLLEIK